MAKNKNSQPLSSKRSRRFNNEKSAKDFAEKIGGQFKDLRDFENRKSNFKVNYTKGDARRNGDNL